MYFGQRMNRPWQSLLVETIHVTCPRQFKLPLVSHAQMMDYNLFHQGARTFSIFPIPWSLRWTRKKVMFYLVLPFKNAKKQPLKKLFSPFFRKELFVGLKSSRKWIGDGIPLSSLPVLTKSCFMRPRHARRQITLSVNWMTMWIPNF